jgi:hypothetical protein
MNRNHNHLNQHENFDLKMKLNYWDNLLNKITWWNKKLISLTRNWMKEIKRKAEQSIEKRKFFFPTRKWKIEKKFKTFEKSNSLLRKLKS